MVRYSNSRTLTSLRIKMSAIQVGKGRENKKGETHDEPKISYLITCKVNL